jgi:hypothetical protein
MLLVQPSCKSAALLSGVVRLESSTVDILGMPVALTTGAAPSIEVGAKSTISFGDAKQPAKAALNVWKIADTVESDLIDEDALLTEEDLKPVAPPTTSARPAREFDTSRTKGSGFSRCSEYRIAVTPASHSFVMIGCSTGWIASNEC